jgi:putative acetyltransferase
VIIRPETLTDYPAIADLHIKMFGNRASEALIVALHRQRRAFAPTLSLVAEDRDEIVGHALFSPRTVSLLGQQVRAVNLAPIAVFGGLQNRGIGGQLIEAGHAAARELGYKLSFLLGHPQYYARFGYQPFAFGVATLTVAVTETPAEITARPVNSYDISGLMQLYFDTEGDRDFAIRPDQEALAWISPNPQIRATVFTRDGLVVGYARVHQAKPAAPRYFLARDAAAAQAMVNYLGGLAGAGELTLPLHPDSPVATQLGAAQIQTWEPGMACSLAPNPFDEYYAAAQKGERTAGQVLWPVEFDLE